MCRMTRAPSLAALDDRGRRSRAAIPGIETMIDADHIVRGEGVSWMRRYLGEDENAPIRLPLRSLPSQGRYETATKIPMAMTIKPTAMMTSKVRSRLERLIGRIDSGPTVASEEQSPAITSR